MSSLYILIPLFMYLRFSILKKYRILKYCLIYDYINLPYQWIKKPLQNARLLWVDFRQIQDFCRWYMVQWRGKDSALLLFLSVDCQNNHNHFFCPRSLDWSTFYQFKTCKKYKSVKVNIFIQTASWYNDFWSYFVTENGFECNLGPFEEISVFLLV